MGNQKEKQDKLLDKLQDNLQDRLQVKFVEDVQKLEKYGFDISDNLLIMDKNIQSNLPCKKCDGDCCGIVPFKHEHIKDIFNKYTNGKYPEFKKRFPYTTEHQLQKNVSFRYFYPDHRDAIIIEFKDKNKYKKLNFQSTECIFKGDSKTGGCLIYEDRPLVCRAYGVKEAIKCPYDGLPEQPKDESLKKLLINNNLLSTQLNVASKLKLHNFSLENKCI